MKTVNHSIPNTATFTFTYETEGGLFAYPLSASSIELVGGSFDRLAKTNEVWNIAVLNEAGEDVTFEFECFQD
ncbi:hypothetical protein [Streptomyces sp. SID2119]|uniref:hypothetical protein n=1 Tax=Streptomyces sp. SID2119 TaxID=2690253 RepID=UPI00136CA127|nr:hypothetical protein [Streptomyces sp. SID2119]MYW29684.1 hypothetical protein [Streptomyces sp. SID2119]